MTRIRCFLITPTQEVEVRLRRYRSSLAETNTVCPFPGNVYHSTSVPIGREKAVYNERGYLCNSVGEQKVPHDDPRWPTTCECGYIFQEEDEWQKDIDQVYKREDTGEEMTLRTTPAGAMWYAWWFDDLCMPQGEHNLVVKTPGGEWMVDSQASNCGMPEDRQQKQHHCWVRHGTPPDVHVDKEGAPTCNAGAGSIQCGKYHGFLRNGWLED